MTSEKKQNEQGRAILGGLDIKTIAIVVGSLVVGSAIYALGASGTSELDAQFKSQTASVNQQLKSVSSSIDTVKTLSDKVAELEKGTKPLGKSLGELSVALKANAEQLTEFKSNAGDTNAVIAKLDERLTKLEGTVGKMAAAQVRVVERLAAVQAEPSEAKVTSTDIPGAVRLAIAESKWLIKDQLHIALSYIYPGEEKVRIGLGDRLLDLSKGASEEFVHDGIRCHIVLHEIDGRHAVISRKCPS